MSDAPEPDERPLSFESELAARDRDKYRVEGELARGGMGVVLRGHDMELGRDVAIKVLDPALAERDEVRQRFIEEAQIGGQLQHPGIVPVYELGLMADDRPWFAMKLVKGRTLAELLAERAGPNAARGKLLGIFEAVCQTVAYAHSKNVIHRDLKPANVMVGAFGEVQVVDWGLAKVLGRETSGKKTTPTQSLMTMIETVRSKEGSSISSASIVGSVLGTPAYMPPEQAQGNIDRLDARADVFALGAILCEILTGLPPYVAEAGDVGGVLELAADGELDPALQRIEQATADEELKELCLRCLSAARGARPKDASEVAEAVSEYVVGSEERAHRAELEAAEQKLIAERSARRVQVTLMGVGVVLLIAAGGAGGSWWLKQQEERRTAELSRAFGEAQPEILAASRDGDFELALELAQAARRMVDAGEPTEELRRRADDAVTQAEARLQEEQLRRAEAQRLAEFLAFLERAETRYATELDDETEALADFEAGFAAFGIVPEDPELEAVLAPYRNTSLGIRMARGFDSWAVSLRGAQGTAVADPFRMDLLTGLGLDLDTDPIRSDVRSALAFGDLTALLEIYRSYDLDSLPPETIKDIGLALYELGQPAEGVHVLSRGADLYPGDFLLAWFAGLCNHEQGSYVRARRLLRVALSMRPDNVDILVKLSDAASSLGDHLTALESAERVLELEPERNGHLRVVADSAWWLGRWERSSRALAEIFELVRTRVQDQLWGWNAAAYAGTLPLEEALARIRAHADRYGSYHGPASAFASLLTVVPDGVEPQPERALQFIQSVDPGQSVDDNFDAAVYAMVHARLGQGPEMLDALGRVPGDRTENACHRAVHELLRAVAYSLIGDADRAAHHHSWAIHTRDSLVWGREDAWADSWLQMVFEQFEPMVAGR